MVLPGNSHSGVTRYKGMTKVCSRSYGTFHRQITTPEMKTVILTHLNALRIEMLERLKDIADADEHSFVLDPFSAKLEDVPDAEELIEIQSSINKRRYFERHGYAKFWIAEGALIAPNLTKIALEKAIIPFATTYLAESTF